MIVFKTEEHIITYMYIISCNWRLSIVDKCELIYVRPQPRVFHRGCVGLAPKRMERPSGHGGRGQWLGRRRQEDLHSFLDDLSRVLETERSAGLDHRGRHDLVPGRWQSADTACYAVTVDTAGVQYVAVLEQVRIVLHQLSGVHLRAPGLKGLLASDADVLLAFRDLADGELNQDGRLVDRRWIDEDDMDGISAARHPACHQALEERSGDQPHREPGRSVVQEVGHVIPFC